MDPIIVQHSWRQSLLIFSDVKNCFNSSRKEYFFLDELIYRKENVIILKGNKKGLEIRYRKSGEKLSEVNYKDDKKEGLEIGYYNSGKRQYEVNYKDSKKEGLAVGYYESGKKKYEVNYKDSKKEGLAIGYYESGKKKYELSYKMVNKRAPELNILKREK